MPGFHHSVAILPCADLEKMLWRGAVWAVMMLWHGAVFCLMCPMCPNALDEWVACTVCVLEQQSIQDRRHVLSWWSGDWGGDVQQWWVTAFTFISCQHFVTLASESECLSDVTHMHCYPDPQHLWWQSLCSCRSQDTDQFTTTSQRC